MNTFNNKLTVRYSNRKFIKHQLPRTRVNKIFRSSGRKKLDCINVINNFEILKKFELCQQQKKIKNT